ncbi:MAG: glycoside hydrolase family 2 sugar binding protein [Capsulimonas sp.]|nr:glycoside hydrolase family 2 sugar binding protein [Capsulimonas sp.]
MKKIIPLCMLLLTVVCAQPPGVRAAAGNSSSVSTDTVIVPDTEWRLWLDRKADWRKEPAFLPEDVHLAKLAPHPPTGGWAALSPQVAKAVTLPTTVEQCDWGVDGLRPYKNEYFYEDRDHQPRNGNYLGVSWWWRTVAVPKSFSGKTAILHIRAAKQLAEVYVNQKLVGYNLVAESAFDCDITDALKPGTDNTIAIRITNPGGRLDWGDWSTANIGGMGIYGGHAFGGLDRGVTLTAHGPVRFNDAWVLNTPEPHTIEAHAVLTSANRALTRGAVIVTVIDSATGKSLGRAAAECTVPPHASLPIAIRVTAPNAKLWDLAHPNLYVARFEFTGDLRAAGAKPGVRVTDSRTTPFGFRWFAPASVGGSAVLRLNGDRIRVYSAISWGFWGLNGLWPTPELARKEVTTAKNLGLNAVNFHRNMPRAECLDDADRMGLLRYAEPGGGMTLIWNKKDTEDSLQRYMQDKIVRMVRDARSHPSLMMYVVQNELDDDTYKHPIAAKVVRRIHQEDPSRVVLLKSGINSPGEMWMAPYDDTLYVDDGKGYSGWWDAHTVGTPDAWVDENYCGPNDYVYRNTDRREIVDYGEMGGSGAADNHALMIRQIKAAGGKSYDLLDHQEIDAAYNRFLDQYGFRASFPTSDALYRKIGEKQYDYWAHVLETARLSDETDYLTLSGWETTAVENHSGIVDNLRNPHGDSRTIREALRPVMPDIQLRTSAVVSGAAPTYDLFFLNESHHPISGRIEVTLRRPNGRTEILGRYPLPAYARDVFSYPVAAGLVTPPLTEAGQYVLTASLGQTHNWRAINVVSLNHPVIAPVAVAGGSPELTGDLAAIGQPTAAYAADKRYAAAVCAPAPQGSRTESGAPVANNLDPELYRWQRFGREGLEFRIAGLPNGPAKVTLGFDEAHFDHAGARVFDVKVNGKAVLKNVDVYKLAEGKDRVWTTTIDTQITDGAVTVAPGTVTSDNAMFSTIRVDTGTPAQTTAVYFGDKPYTAKDGVVWAPYVSAAKLPSGILDHVRAGMGLLVLADQESDITGYAHELEAAGAFHFDGLVGSSFAPWMGSWYIVRRHPLYAGLPQDTIMKSDYQVPVGSSNGIIATGPNIEWVTAFSRDHSRTIGAGDVIAKLGKGRILFHIVPRMNTPFQRKWLSNALTYLSGTTPSQ